jgi:hypothetical protein
MDLNRDDAYNLLTKYLKNKNLIKHSLAVEALMKALAKKFNENEQIWRITGLLHDLDWEMTQNEPEKHSLVAYEILKENGYPEEIAKAIKIHNHLHHLEPETLMEKALYSTEEITGLIVASTLVLPSKSIKDLTVTSILKRFKEKAFAKGVNRELINLTPQYLGISLEELTEIALKAMQEISKELEL